MAERCPKCNGMGWLLYDPDAPFAGANTNAGPWRCPVCINGVIYDDGVRHGTKPSDPFDINKAPAIKRNQK